MTHTSTWLVLTATIVIGLFGLFAAARGDGVFEFVGWLVVAFAVLFGATMIRRLTDQAFEKH